MFWVWGITYPNMMSLDDFRNSSLATVLEGRHPDHPHMARLCFHVPPHSAVFLPSWTPPSFCSFKGEAASARLWGWLHQTKRAHSFTMWMAQGGCACGAQRSDSLRTDLHVTSMEPSNHSRGKRECPFRYWLSHLVTQRSQWQSEFEGESWNICTCTHTSMMEFRASGTLGKLTDLYIQYIFFEQSLAKLPRLALNLPYSWLSFPRSCDYLPSCLRLICDISFSLNTYPGLCSWSPPAPLYSQGQAPFPTLHNLGYIYFTECIQRWQNTLFLTILYNPKHDFAV